MIQLLQNQSFQLVDLVYILMSYVLNTKEYEWIFSEDDLSLRIQFDKNSNHKQDSIKLLAIF